MGWCSMSKMLVVHVSVDRWDGKNLTGSLIGAWTCPDDDAGPATSHVLLDAIRDGLSAQWRPASVEEISAWHSAFTSDPSVPWEQISLF